MASTSIASGEMLVSSAAGRRLANAAARPGAFWPGALWPGAGPDDEGRGGRLLAGTAHGKGPGGVSPRALRPRPAGGSPRSQRAMPLHSRHRPGSAGRQTGTTGDLRRGPAGVAARRSRAPPAPSGRSTPATTARGPPSRPTPGTNSVGRIQVLSPPASPWTCAEARKPLLLHRVEVVERQPRRPLERVRQDVAPDEPDVPPGSLRNRNPKSYFPLPPPACTSFGSSDWIVVGRALPGSAAMNRPAGCRS